MEDSDEKRCKFTEKKTVSVWSHVLHPSNIDQFKNPFYLTSPSVVNTSSMPSSTTDKTPLKFQYGVNFCASVWSGLFFRHNLVYRRESKQVEENVKQFVSKYKTKEDNNTGDNFDDFVEFPTEKGISDAVSPVPDSDPDSDTSFSILNKQLCDIDRCPNFSDISHFLNILVLQNTKFTHVPFVFGNFTNLKKLVLDNNKITHISAIIGKCTNLTSLSLKGNLLCSICGMLTAEKKKAEKIERKNRGENFQGLFWCVRTVQASFFLGKVCPVTTLRTRLTA